MIRRPPRSTQGRSSAASDVYKRQVQGLHLVELGLEARELGDEFHVLGDVQLGTGVYTLSVIHISEPTRPY